MLSIFFLCFPKRGTLPAIGGPGPPNPAASLSVAPVDALGGASPARPSLPGVARTAPPRQRGTLASPKLTDHPAPPKSPQKTAPACHPPEAPPASVHPSTSPSLLQRSQGARCSRHPPPRRHAPTITHWCVCLPRHRVTVPRRRTRLPTTPLPQASRLFPSWRRPPRLWAPLLLRRQLLPLPPSCRLLRRPCLRLARCR